jgi:metal-dependent amidase/aminoacylase/carboxypeptidase family protein
MKADARLHTIVMNGGEAVNIIPSYTTMRIMVRSVEADYLRSLVTRVENCVKGCALATGTNVDVREICRVLPSRFNQALSMVVTRNLINLGERPQEIDLNSASSDFGNVSQILPALKVLIRTHPLGINWHSKEAAESATTEDAHSGMILAANALAATVIDLFMEPQLIEEARREFSQSNCAGTHGQPIF